MTRPAVVISASTGLALLCLAGGGRARAAFDEFPQENGWSRVTPSVVWCGDPATIEFHVVGRTDVAQVAVADGYDTERTPLYDDGTHGDLTADDNIFTAAGVPLPCPASTLKYGDAVYWSVGFVRATLDNGTELGNNFPIGAGLVRRSLQNAFPVTNFGNGLSATDYAFFIDDHNHEVMDGYPIANVFCGTTNFAAYQKLYSIFPDRFDVVVVTPGLRIFRPVGFAENVPYNVLVRNDATGIGLPAYNNTATFGSAGRLKAAVFESFMEIEVFDHEVAHTWGAAIGNSLGLLESGDFTHFNSLSDIGGQLSAYYSSGNLAGHFSYNGDGTWRLVANTDVERYAPLELYIMGLIPPEEVPPIRLLTAPNLADPQHITAASVQTVTMQQIMAAEGGARVPSSANAQRHFNVGYVVTQDGPFNDAAYTFFSVLSRQLMTKEAPEASCCSAPFYWATGGRATLNSKLGALSAPFTDDPLVAGSSLVRATHITELRTRIDALRARYSLAPFTWTDPTLAAGSTVIKGSHLGELRAALAQAYAAAGFQVPVYAEPSVMAEATAVKAAHLTELRAAVVGLE